MFFFFVLVFVHFVLSYGLQMCLPRFLPIADLSSSYYVYFVFSVKAYKGWVKRTCDILLINQKVIITFICWHSWTFKKCEFVYKNVSELVRFICLDGSIPESETSVISANHIPVLH